MPARLHVGLHVSLPAYLQTSMSARLHVGIHASVPTHLQTSMPARLHGAYTPAYLYASIPPRPLP